MKVGDPKGAVSMALDNISTQVPTKTKVEDSPEAILEAAKAFEAVFLNEIMKSMRKTLPEDGLLNSGFFNRVRNPNSDVLAKNWSVEETIGSSSSPTRAAPLSEIL